MEDLYFENGAKWCKADFHLHTNSDKQFKYDGQSFISDYVEALQKANINIGVITNHNKFNYNEFKELRNKANLKGIFLLPGVELSVSDGANGIHTLIVFSDEWLSNGDGINLFLQNVFSTKTPQEYENADLNCSYNIIDLIKKLEEYNLDFFIVFAHVEGNKGLWQELDGGRIIELGKNPLFRKYTLGFQKVRSNDNKGPCRKNVKLWLNDWYPAEVEGSDCKNLSNIEAKSQECYLKLGSFTFDSVKQALLEHDSRISKENLSKRITHTWIKSLHFDGIKYNNLQINFSNELNTLIGVRGSGKSAIIETVRKIFSLPLNDADDKEYKSKLPDYMLGNGGKVKLCLEDSFENSYTVTYYSGETTVRIQKNNQPIDNASIMLIPMRPLFFGQKELANRNDYFENNLIEKLLLKPLSEIRRKISNQLKIIHDIIGEYLSLTNLNDKIQEQEKKKTDLIAKLDLFKNLDLENRLQKKLEFEKDSEYLKNSYETISNYILNLRRINDSYKDSISNIFSYESLYNKFIIDDFKKSFSNVLEIEKKIDKLNNYFFHSEQINNFDNINKKYQIERNRLIEEFAQIEKNFIEDLKSQGKPIFNLNDYYTLKKELNKTESLLEILKSNEKDLLNSKKNLERNLNILNDLYQEEFNIISHELNLLNDTQDYLKIKIGFQDDFAKFLEFLKNVFRGSRLSEAFLKDIVDEYKNPISIYLNLDKIQQNSNKSNVTFCEWFKNSLVALLSYQVPNSYNFLYNGKPLQQYSLGQRASALILFILNRKENDVIIIDQPEDDLDNQTLYKDVISTIKKTKPNTQFIFATHNPNIPVLGDAEQVISCRMKKELLEINTGSIDKRTVQEDIISVMEGGREAFNKRKEIYNRWNTKN